MKEFLWRHGQFLESYTFSGSCCSRESTKTTTFSIFRSYFLYPKKNKPQKLEMRKGGLHTLNNFQRLGNIQWSRPLLKFSIRDFEQLSVILKKISDQNSNRQLTETIRQIWTQAKYTIQKQQVQYINYGQPWEA